MKRMLVLIGMLLSTFGVLAAVGGEGRFPVDVRTDGAATVRGPGDAADAVSAGWSSPAVPPALAPWVAWVRDGRPELACPVHFMAASRHCVWPGELVILTEPGGGRFRQVLTVFRPALVPLPGDARNWPEAVTLDGVPAIVVDRDGVPHVALPQPGRHVLSGRFVWQSLPGSLAVPTDTGLLRLVRDGVEVLPLPLRGNSLWLRETVDTAAGAPEDAVAMQVFRRVADGHPGMVTTHLAVEVSGRPRELVLGYPLLDGFIPVEVSAALPARLEPDGALRAQLRPGRWAFRVTARHPAPLSVLMPQPERQPSFWPAAETWVYAASPADRLTDVEGVRQIDPRQVQLPPDWTDLPAYRLSSADDRFVIRELRRGDPQPEPDRLTLARELWLDFDGGGLTVRDRIQGQMNAGWRLTAQDGLALGQVSIDGLPQFITRLPDQSRAGVEVRGGNIDLVAESRLTGQLTQMPASGWDRDFSQLSAHLHLPPGWRLIAVSGADRAPSAWVARWTLYDVFLVLIVTLATGRLWGWRWAPLALVTLALCWHQDDAPRMVWLFLLAVTALLRVVSTDSRFHALLRQARWGGLAVLVVIALPFIVTLAREAMHPQLAGSGYALRQQPRAPAAPVAEPAPADRAEALAESATPPGKRMPYEALSSRPEPLVQVDPSATIQTGPGLPDWRWEQARLTWTGPVPADETLGLYLLDPVGLRMVNIVIIALLLALGWRMLDLRRRAGPDDGNDRAASAASGAPLAGLSSLLLAVLVGGMAAGAPATAQAADAPPGFPPAELLQTLGQRLEAAVPPAPRAGIAEMALTLSPDRYDAVLTVHALTETALPLPVDANLMSALSVTLDGASAGHRVLRDQQQLWLLVPAGVRQVGLAVALPAIEQVQIPLPLRPARVSTWGSGWMVEGLDTNGRPEAALSLRREQVEPARDSLAPATLPAALRLERTLQLGLTWEVITVLERTSPPGTPVSVAIPVLPGASVLTESVTVRDGKVLATMAPGATRLSWRSRLDPVSRLTLVAPDTRDWLEVWRAEIGPIWHVAVDGLAPIHHRSASGGQWTPTWHPWPGETVRFEISRPLGVPGNTFTIDSSRLAVTPGNRATDHALSLRLRSSQGATLPLRLPDGSELLSVAVNGQSQPVRLSAGRVDLPVVPGEQSFDVRWRSADGVSAAWQTPAIDPGAASVNAELTVDLPRDRWVLWTQGPTMGPAVLFWSLLGVLLLVAGVLGRVGRGRLPLGASGWLVLGVGLSQVSVFALLLVAGWFLALHLRRDLARETTRDKLRFNLAQIGIVLLTLAVAVVLVGAVRNGLLGQPAMLIEGNGSSSYQLNWYQDRVADAAYPQGRVLSTPLWVYRALMMAWALWLALALLSWLRWAWPLFSQGGLWQPVVINPHRRLLLQKGAQVPEASGNADAASLPTERADIPAEEGRSASQPATPGR